MSSRFLAAAVGLSAVALLSGCDHKSEFSTGPVRTETRNVGKFDSIEVNGATRLEITVGAPASVVVEGRERFLERLDTEVHGDTLRIKTRKKDWVSIGTSPRLIVRVTLPVLKELEVEGGNDIELTGFNGGTTKIRLEGAANLKGSGRLDELSIFMAGAGHADLDKVIAGTANVTVAGVGSVMVHPVDTLDARMNGVGAIFYSGSPRNVNTRVNGLGTIGQRDADRAAPDHGPQAPIDPDSLQPEYDDRTGDEGKTEVI
jgi:hypothetical protein